MRAIEWLVANGHKWDDIRCYPHKYTINQLMELYRCGIIRKAIERKMLALEIALATRVSYHGKEKHYKDYVREMEKWIQKNSGN